MAETMAIPVIGGEPQITCGPPARAGSPLDLVHLTRQSFGDRHLEAELLRLFLRQTEQISRLLAEPSGERAPGQSDLELVHLLAGSARVVGATRVAVLASEGEAELRRGDASSALDGLRSDALRREIASVTGFIEELLR